MSKNRYFMTQALWLAGCFFLLLFQLQASFPLHSIQSTTAELTHALGQSLPLDRLTSSLDLDDASDALLTSASDIEIRFLSGLPILSCPAQASSVAVWVPFSLLSRPPPASIIS